MIYTSSLTISIMQSRNVCVFTGLILSTDTEQYATCVSVHSFLFSVSHTSQRHWFELRGPRNKRKERQRRPYDDPARRGNRKWDLWPTERLLLCFPARLLMELRVSLRFLSQLMLGDTDESWETAHRAKSHREPKGGLSYTTAWETTRP